MAANLKTLASIEAYRKYNVYRSDIAELISKWRIIPTHFQHALCFYKLHKWEKQLLALKLGPNGTLRRYDKDYIVVWSSPRGEFISADYDTEFWLSFREAQPEYGLPAYVIIWKFN